MDVRVLPDAGAIAEAAADLVERALTHPEPTIGLAAGATPLPTYAELVRRHRTSGLRLDHARFVLLDEYVGVESTDPASFHRNVHDALVGPTGGSRNALTSPDGASGDPEAACDDYERVLAALARRELQVLGIGRNGHIGFNEPGTPFDSRTHVVELHETTLADNRRHFAAERAVPTHAITMGIGTILEARRLVLIATGPAKSPAIAHALEGPVGTECPASAIRTHHDVVVLLDPAAASELRSQARSG